MNGYGDDWIDDLSMVDNWLVLMMVRKLLLLKLHNLTPSASTVLIQHWYVL